MCYFKHLLMEQEESKVNFVVPKLKPRLFCGLSSDVKGNVHFSDEDTIIHPIGRVLVVDNLSNSSQKYIKIPVTHKTVNIVAISPNRQYVAISEEGVKPSVSLYCLKTRKRLIILGNPIKDCSGNKFEVITFTHDSKYLIAVVCAPDWLLIYYNWQKGKVESSVKAVYSNNPTNITQVACNPKDRSVCVIVGESLFRLMSCLDNVWRQYGFQRAENLPMTGACWVTSEIVLVGTRDGRLILVESADLRGVHKAYEINEIVITPKMPETEGRQNQISLASNLVTDLERSGVYEVRALTAFSKGFAYSCATGIVNIFEKVEPTRWVKKNVIDVHGAAFGTLNLDKMDQVHCISISPKELKMLITTGRSDIYHGDILFDQDFQKEPVVKFKVLFNGFHQGPIGAVSVCLWKPFFLTVGSMDRTCRIWNYKTRSLVLIKEFPDEIYSASFHPSGFYCLLGFTDKLKLLMILIDDMKPIRHVDIKGCTLVEFAQGGHIFAAVNGVAVEVYSAITFENICVLTGHLGPIRSLHFVKEDLFLYTCGEEGSLYKWDLRNRQRIEDIFTKNCGNFDIAAKTSGEFVYTVGTDGTLKEISNGEVTREVSLNQYSLYTIVMSNSNQLMFLGGEKGTVVSIVYPLVYPPAFREFAMHTKPINKIVITSDDGSLVSVSQDGALCLWEVTKAEGKQKDLINGFSHLTEVMLDIDEWNNRLAEIGELRTRMAEIEGEHSYIMRQVTAAHEAALREVHGGYVQTIDDLKSRIKQMEREHLLEIHNYNTKLESALSSHGDEIEKKEREYAVKLIQEYDRYDQMVKNNQDAEAKSTKKFNALKKASVKALAELTESKNSAIEEKSAKIEELQNEIQNLLSQYDELKRVIEEDCDMEIQETKMKYEEKLATEAKTIQSLMNENGLLNKRSNMLENEIASLESNVKDLLNERENFKTTIAVLSKETDVLKTEVSERNWLIAKKDELVVKVTKSNERSTKEKYVRDMKLHSLKLLMEPKDSKIESLEGSVGKLEEEIKSLYETIATKDFEISQTKMKIKVLKTEIDKQNNARVKCEVYIKKLLYEIYKVSKVVSEPRKLESAVSELIRDYLPENENKDLLCDVALKEEFHAQRKYLESIIYGLYNQLHQNDKISKNKNDYAWICTKRVRNMTDEIKKLRKCYNDERERVKVLEKRLYQSDFNP